MTSPEAKDNLEDLIRRRTDDLASVNAKLEMFRKVLENTSEAVIITDLNGNIVDMNDAMSMMSGYSRDELIGKNTRIFQSERHAAEFYERMWDSILHLGHWEGELWDRKKDGSLFPKWQTINTVYDEKKGETAKLYGVSTDISVIKEAKQAESSRRISIPENLPNRLLFSGPARTRVRAQTRTSALCPSVYRPGAVQDRNVRWVIQRDICS
jgi:PAS domain S-box-containing protein